MLATIIAVTWSGLLRHGARPLYYQIWISAAALVVIGLVVSLLLPIAERLICKQPRLAGLQPTLRSALAILGSPLAAARVILYSCIIHGCSIMAMVVLTAGQGASLSLFDALIFVPPIMLAAALPVSLAGWGVREGAAVVLLGEAGINSAQALATSIAFGIISLVPVLIGCMSLMRSPSGPVRSPGHD